MYGASTASNASIVLASIRSGAAEQEWYIEETDPIVGQRYCLRNRGSGMYLDISGNGTTNGTHVQQYPKGEYPSEHWMISHDSGDMYVLHTDLVSADIYSSGDMVLDGRANCVAGAQVNHIRMGICIRTDMENQASGKRNLQAVACKKS